MTVFELRDENNENLKVHLKYTGCFPSNFAEGKSRYLRKGVSQLKLEANKIVAGCPSKYTE
ncbi:cytochrome c maturation protein CcmE [Methanosarcina sp. UBA5]|uniref:cytochrome c maturation protein CcmE domain-containing protein n=1 Tax=Methanosarcina sp. UBA5 TaxID=1915593 RepID=UPI00260044CA|nr:cytochrome c maturation protein CcmE [Methanosarcina sp. UBA5]